MLTHHFISYSVADAADFALKLCDALAAGPPTIPVWLDKRQLIPGRNWDEQLAEAIRRCDSLLFIMTRDSVEPTCACTQEWTRALKYKKPIIPLRLHADAELPFRLEPRQYIDFTGNFDSALAQLRNHLQWLSSPTGVLQSLKDRLADAKRDLRRATDVTQQTRIQDDLAQLEKQIAEQQRIVDDPKAAADRVAASVAAGLEREREPQKLVSGEARTKFINPPPMTAPSYFQDRYVETKLIADFLRDDSRRMLTLVGRGGTGKTALACRLLKALEHGHLPDDLGTLPVDGIVYLSAVGTRRVNVPDLYADLLKRLPPETARHLESLYKNPQTSTEAKMRALLAAFPHGRYIVLLDNFEDVVDAETLTLRDTELEEALTALLQAPAHTIKVLITTRVAPRNLALVQPAWQTRLDLDEGLASPFAENILREMDVGGKVGLKTAPEDLLAEARFRTRGYPRALEALFAILSADRDTTLQEILQESVGAHGGAPLPENVVRDLVGEAFDRLDSTAQKVMQALATYGRPVTPTAVDYLLQPFLTGVNSAPVLSRLVNMHFVRKEAGRYYLHPVDRAYVFECIPKGNASDRNAETPPFTQFALWHNGAEYFKQTRKPPENLKTIEDLASQLAEFDLRFEGENYDEAMRVLMEINFDYLYKWGFSRLMAELHERLQGKLTDPLLKEISLGHIGWVYYKMGQYQKGVICFQQALDSARRREDRDREGGWISGLGNCYEALGQYVLATDYFEQALMLSREIGKRHWEANDLSNLGGRYENMGQIFRAIDYYEQALTIFREFKDHEGEVRILDYLGDSYALLGQTAHAIGYHQQALIIARETLNRNKEGVQLSDLGDCYAALGQTAKALEYYEQSLTIARETEYRVGEAVGLENLGHIFVDKCEWDKAIKLFNQALQIADEIKHLEVQHFIRWGLSLAHLYSGDLDAARASAESASQYDEPRNSHNILVLLGLIALRQGEHVAAQKVFTDAIAQAETMLMNCAQYYAALDTKGLALAGLALCEGPQHVTAAIAAYRAARAINKDVGIVQRVLRLFDELAKADANGVLVEVRAAATAGEN